MTELQHDGRPEYVPGEWRDLPRGQAGYVKPHAAVVKRTGLDWDALTPRCAQCGQPSGQLADGARCPTCRGVTPVDVFATGRKTTTAVTRSSGVAAAYDELTDDELEDRFTAPTQTPAAASAVPPATPSAAAGPTSAAGTGKGKPTRQPTPVNQAEETTVAEPAFPPYIVQAATVMRDSEGHDDPAVRAARKAVANALVGLDRELRRHGSIPAAQATPRAKRGQGSRLDPVRDELIARYLAGESTTQLGAAYGIAQTAVGKYLRTHGVQMRPRSGGQTKSTSTTTTGATS